MSKSKLIEALRAGEVTVTFTKKDGTDRVMRCTRNGDMIPVESHPKTSDTPQDDSSDIIKAFDLDINEWRSFNYTTMKA